MDDRPESGTSRRGHLLAARVLLAATTTLLMLLAFECGLRLRTRLHDRTNLAAALSRQLPVAPGSDVHLGDLVRASADPDVLYELRAGLQNVRFLDVRVSTNDMGLRSPEIPVQKAAGSVRILGLGDSIMFGWGVPADRVYLRLLEAALRRRRPHVTWQVINTGVPGYNTVMEVATLEDKCLIWDPDLVIVGFSGNDLALPEFIRDEHDVWSLSHSFLLEFARRMLQTPRHSQDESGGLSEAGLTSYDPSREPPPARYAHMLGWDAYAKALTRLAELAREHGFEVVEAYFGPGVGPRKQRSIDLARAHGFGVVDVGALQLRYLTAHGLRFDQYAGSVLTRSKDDPHPSALSHALAAEALYDYLAGAGLLDRLTSKQRTCASGPSHDVAADRRLGEHGGRRSTDRRLAQRPNLTPSHGGDEPARCAGTARPHPW